MQAPNIHCCADEAERTSSVTEVWRKRIQAGHSCPEHVGALEHCPWQAGRWRSTNSSLRTSSSFSSSSSRTKGKGRCLETMARYLLTLLLSNCFAIGVEWIFNQTIVLHPVCDSSHRHPILCTILVYRLPGDFVAFPLVVFLWLHHEFFTLRSCWCHPLDG